MPIDAYSLPSSPQSHATFLGFLLIGANVLWATNAASTLFIQPLPGTLLAIVLLHGQFTSVTIIEGLLIIISVYIISRQ